MNAINSIHDDVPAAPQAGLQPQYYPQRLTDDELDTVLDKSTFCLMGKHPAAKLTSYICAVAKFELERRKLLDEGGEIVEVHMPPIPCTLWTDLENARALCKLSALAFTSEGEVRTLFQKLFTVVEVECTFRLGMKE